MGCRRRAPAGGCAGMLYRACGGGEGARVWRIESAECAVGLAVVEEIWRPLGVEKEVEGDGRAVEY